MLFAPFVVLANTVAAKPTVVRESCVSLPIARYFNTTGALDLVLGYLERARSFVKDSCTVASERAVGALTTSVHT